MVCNLKEKLGYVSLDSEQESNKSVTKIEEIFELPGGQKIIVGKKQFQPSLQGWSLLESIKLALTPS